MHFTYQVNVVVLLSKLSCVLDNSLQVGQSLPYLMVGINWGLKTPLNRPCIHEYLQYFVELFLILHHTHIGLAVVENVLACFRCAGGVDPCAQTPM